MSRGYLWRTAWHGPARASRVRAWSLGLTIALLASAALAPGAKAGLGVSGSFGQEGRGAGEFAFPSGVAVNEATGAVYVADGDCCSFLSGGQRVSQFTGDGTFVRAWGWGVATGESQFEVCTTTCQAGIRGTGDGQFALGGAGFATPGQVAIDQSDGSVYVADNLNDRVQKFSATGQFLGKLGSTGGGDGQLSGPLGVAADSTSGDVYVADTGNGRVQRFDSSGAFVAVVGGPGGGEGELSNPSRVAVDSTGRLYVLDAGNGRVQRFSATGTFDQVFAAGSYASPSELMVDPGDDHVYIAGSSADLTVQGILEFDGDGLPVDVHAANSGIGSGFPAGLAIRSSTGRIYGSSLFSPKAVMILGDVDPPSVSIAAAGDVASESARLHGSVNPQGPPTTRYRFEHSTDGAAWTSVPTGGDVEVGVGTSDVAVDQMATGLAPNMEYRVRLVATKDFNLPSVVSDEVTFRTSPAAPLVRALEAGSRSDTAAWLGGDVNPRNSQTTYFVEYTVASDVAFEDSSRVPAPPQTADAGAGDEFVAVSRLVSGLAPDTAYRFRVVASNAGGTTVGPDRTFVTDTSESKAPPGRGYEMVSPLDKNGGDIDRSAMTSTYATSGAAASGEALAYVSLSQFAGARSGAFESTYRSVRDEAGQRWITGGISPPVIPAPPIEVATPSVWALSRDLSKAVVSTFAPLTSDTGGGGNLFLQDNTAPGLSWQLLSGPEPGLPASMGGTLSFVAATEDMEHVVFDADSQLTGDAPPEGGVYAWTEGQLRFVGAGSGGSGVSAGAIYPGDHVISEDGRRIFFNVGGQSGGNGDLYVRENASVTTPVSGSERDGDDTADARPATFMAASAEDGSLALFTSPEKLTGDATAEVGSCAPGSPLEGCHSDLYLWDADKPVGARLTDLTTSAGGGGVLGVAGVADDLSVAYFVATGVLADGAVEGRPNLYAWTRADGVSHVATLVLGDAPVWGVERDQIDRRFRDARVTSDGGRLLLASRARLTARDNAQTKQVYLFDLAQERVVCVSCGSGDGASSEDAWLFFPPVAAPGAFSPFPETPLRLPRNLSADGTRVFFETAQELVEGDVNGLADVYMWSGGHLTPMSSGKGGSRSEFIDASADGDDVFFTTRERLVGRDTDNQIDVYDARVGGGFAEPPGRLECVGDPCRGPLASRPALAGPGSGPGSDDRGAFRRAALSVRPLSARARRALAAGRRVVLEVRVNKPGTVSVRGIARIGKQTRIVIKAVRRAKRAGALRIPLKLTKPGRARIVQSGRLWVSLSVRLGGQPRALSLKLVSVRDGGRGR